MEKKERYKKGKKLIIDLNKKFQPKTPAGIYAYNVSLQFSRNLFLCFSVYKFLLFLWVWDVQFPLSRNGSHLGHFHPCFLLLYRHRLHPQFRRRISCLGTYSRSKERLRPSLQTELRRPLTVIVPRLALVRGFLWIGSH